MEPESSAVEWLKCSKSCAYFLWNFVEIEEATEGMWIPFELWPTQRQVLQKIEDNRLMVILKARQLGQTWLALGFALWLMIFRPAATILLFSKRDDEAMVILKRLKDMYARLPDFLRARVTLKSNEHFWELSNGSNARAFPNTGGDSYTASLVIGDEFDLMPDQAGFMRSTKPTIDAGGRMILVSRVDKAEPMSMFKQIYRAAKNGLNDWGYIFLPWHARPSRDAAWYEAQRVDILARTGALDDLHEQYPETDTEALAPRSLDKRIPPDWLEACYSEDRRAEEEKTGRQDDGRPTIPALEIYVRPQKDVTYVMGGDPAEGNPTSDPSACEVLDQKTGEQVARFAGRIQPAVFAGYVHELSKYYNGAAALIERNNHGHSVLLWLKDNARSVPLVAGEDGRPGWLDNSKGKHVLYTEAADAFRLHDARLHSFETLTQLQSIEGASLRAPAGQPDDAADAWALANLARSRAVFSGAIGSVVQGVDPLKEIDEQKGF